MTSEKKAAPDVCGIEDGDEQEIFFVYHSIRNPDAKQAFPIYSTLPAGEENAVPTEELMLRTGYQSARALQSAIRKERAAGCLILSRGKGGYFRPKRGAEGKAEIRRYIATLEHRAKSTLATLKTAKTVLAVMDGQLSI